ncbi:unnamed protein product [Pieris macdunnoughi]|uniref:Uncharacterized protein n=1 Tax=Pieris macdunnoughi TaxID=345717 RepID=A0A821PFX9_9NEOP|nr:unnamed protein product [Pieris macdunnoughi]
MFFFINFMQINSVAKKILAFILVLCLVKARTTQVLFLTAVACHLDDINDEYQDILSNNHTVDENEERPLAKYEVTEIIEELPNTVTLGPIITNYTISKPLNLATTKATNTTVENETKKNYLSILHVKVEYDKDNLNDKNPNVFSIKDYINGLKKGLVSGFNSIINKFRKKNVNDELPNVTGSVIFINKLRKSTDVNSREHKSCFDSVRN